MSSFKIKLKVDYLKAGLSSKVFMIVLI